MRKREKNKNKNKKNKKRKSEFKNRKTCSVQIHVILCSRDPF